MLRISVSTGRDELDECGSNTAVVALFPDITSWLAPFARLPPCRHIPAASHSSILLSSVDNGFVNAVLTAQTETERMFRIGIAIERRTELIGFPQSRARVHLVLQRCNSTIDSLRTSWIVGALRWRLRHLDGAKSRDHLTGSDACMAT